MKTVLITGASRGIGRAVAEKFLQEGYFVIGTSRTGQADFTHDNLILFPLELANQESRATCAQSIITLGKNITVLINNAGIFHEKDESVIIDADVLRETLEANLIGPIDFTEKILAADIITEQIINLSSRRGSMEYTKESLYPDYSISKAGLNMFTRILAARLKGKIIVSSVHPGFVQTDMNEGEGEISPAEVADDIFDLIGKKVESGQFWYKGEKFPW